MVKDLTDPTHTITLRKKTIQNLNHRFDFIKKFLREHLYLFFVDDSADQYVNYDTSQKVSFFLRLFNETVHTTILENKEIDHNNLKDHWLNEKVEISYMRGVKHARDVLLALGLFVDLAKYRTVDSVSDFLSLKDFTVRPDYGIIKRSSNFSNYFYNLPSSVSLQKQDIFQFKPKHFVDDIEKSSFFSKGYTVGEPEYTKHTLSAQEIFNIPLHKNRSKIFYSKVFSQLKNVTETMQARITEILVDGITQGQSIEDISMLLTKKVDGIGKNRARLIARTEIVKAYNVGAIIETEYLQEKLDKNVIKMKWITNLDGRERPAHNARHNKIYLRQKVLSLLGEPNCRCSVVPYIK